MRRICVFTGTRAEYGLLRWIAAEIDQDPDLELQLLVTGMHLSPDFGLTYREIEEDGFEIDEKVEMLLSGDSPRAIAKSIGLGTIGYADALARLEPDLLVLLGDRFEVLAAAQAAVVSRIPIAHIHGGEATEGLIDEPIRHAVTKMSHFHLVATEAYGRRVVQLGEAPERVTFVGAPGLDNLERLQLLDCEELERELDFELGDPTFLVTYHPVTLSGRDPSSGIEELLAAVDRFNGVRIIFTLANADTHGRIINDRIREFAEGESDRVRVYASLGQVRYLSVLKEAEVVIGNSSSGLIEAPAVGTPTVNVGERQRGRVRADSVIDCGEDAGEIASAIRGALDDEFQAAAEDVESPYGQPGASRRIKEKLKEVSLDGVLMKRFHDVDFELERV